MLAVKACEGFYKYFGARGIRFMDARSSVLRKQYVLNVIVFDDWLHEEKGYQEEKHGSMSDFIKKEFGESAEEFVRQLF